MRRKYIVLAAVVACIVVLLTIEPHPPAHAQGPTQVYGGAPVTAFTCRVTAATAAAQCQAAPAAGLKAYVTDVVVSNNTAGAQTIKLVTGTGTNCGTGTADLSHAVVFGAAVGNWSDHYQMPLLPPAASAICVTPSAATSVSATVTGFVAP